MWFLVGICLSVVVMLPYAYAETIDATPTTTVVNNYVRYYPYTGTSGPTYADTLMEACIGRVLAFDGPDNHVTGVTEPDTCHTSWGYNVGVSYANACHSPNVSNGTQCVTTNYTCPATGGWTLTGQSCTRADCAAGQDHNADGSCAYSCNKSAGTSLKSGFWDLGTSPTNSPMTNPCIDHCSASFNGTSPAVSAVVGGVTHYYAQGSYEVLNGNAACQTNTPNVDAITTAPTNTQSCGANQTSGYVNGVFTCVDNPTSTPVPQPPPVSSTTTKTETVTNPDNSTTTTETTTNPDGSKTVKITNNPAPGSTAPATSTTTTTGGGKSLGGATEATLQDIKDKLDKQAQECELHPDRPGCKDLGDPGSLTPGADILENRTISITEAGHSVGSDTGSCPGAFTVHGISVDFSSVCTGFGYIRPILLALAWLAAGLIVVGGFKGA